MEINQMHLFLPQEVFQQVLEPLDPEVNLVCRAWYAAERHMRAPRLIKSLRESKILNDKKDPQIELRSICEKETRMNLCRLFYAIQGPYMLQPKGWWQTIVSRIWGGSFDESRMLEPGYMEAVFEKNCEALEGVRTLNMTIFDVPSYTVSHYFLPEKCRLFTQLTSITLVTYSGSEHMGFRRIPPHIFQCTLLQKLDLRNNLIKEVPKSIGQLVQLTHLSLSSNRIESLPESVSKLTKLQQLHLEKNQLTVLPSGIGKLCHLEALYLSNNRLKSVADEMGDCHKLILLELKENQLKTVPPALENLTGLQVLNLVGNPIEYLPEFIRNVPYLNLDSRRYEPI